MAARNSGYVDFYLFFKNEDSHWKLATNNIDGILTGSYASTKSISSYHKDLGGVPDAAFKINGEVVIFVGKYFET